MFVPVITGVWLKNGHPEPEAARVSNFERRLDQVSEPGAPRPIRKPVRFPERFPYPALRSRFPTRFDTSRWNLGSLPCV